MGHFSNAACTQKIGSASGLHELSHSKENAGSTADCEFIVMLLHAKRICEFSVYVFRQLKDYVTW